MDSKMQPWQPYRSEDSHDDDDYDYQDDAASDVLFYYNLFVRRRQLMDEFKEHDAERKASWLQEQAKIKEKAEKKRLKKQKQKERKRQEKLEKEKENTQSNMEENLAVGDKLQDGAGGGTEAETEASAQGDKLQDGPGGGTEAGTEGSAQAGVEVQAEGGVEVRAEGGAEAGFSGKSDSSDVSDDEYYDVEELDMASCFVSQTAQRVQHKLEVKPKPEKGRKSPRKEQLPKESHDDVSKEASSGKSALTDNVEISNDLAARGNKWARDGRYDLAVDCFTQAIQFNPTEMKLFGNRAFCLEKLQEYEKALADAELCLNMSPGWIKGLFRKGRALAGLKRYEEAAQAFQGVLKLDASCAEAAQEMMRIQILQLMGYGFTREQSSNALIIHGTVAKAREVLSRLNPQMVPVAADTTMKTGYPGNVHSASNIQNEEHRHTELFPVWVGNLTSTVTEELLSNMFSKAGSLHSVKLLLGRRCAFVNFTRQECCDVAIRLFHKFELMGEWIVVRYPDRIPAYGGFSKAALKSHDLRNDNYQWNSN